MKCRLVLHSIFFAIVATSSAAAYGQLSNEDAIRAAEEHLRSLGAHALAKNPQVRRSSMAVRGESEERIRVHFDDAAVSLNQNGTLSGLSIDGSAMEPRTDTPEKFASDDQAWQAVEEILSRSNIELPPDLERHSLSRGKQAYKEFIYTFYLRPKPYGYGNSSGNYVCVQLHRVTGAVRHVSVASGWTYEEPNLQTSHQEAIQAAMRTLGGSESDWTGKQLLYTSASYERAPEHIRRLLERQVMRLMYIISSDRGSVMVDSVTGDVIQTMHLDRGGSTPSSNANRGKAQNGQPSWVFPGVIGFGVLMLVGFALLIGRHRKAKG